MFMMEVGEKLSIALCVGDEMIRCTGVVATKYPQVGNGMDFVDMAPDDRLRLSKYLAEMSHSICAERQQTAVAILHYELSRVPWHVGKYSSEFDAFGTHATACRMRALFIVTAHCPCARQPRACA